MSIERNLNPDQCQIGSVPECYITTVQAASIIGFSKLTLKLSRHTGVLAGVKSPVFLKVGRNVRYLKSDILAWMGQFEKKSNTAEESISIKNK